MSGADFNKGRRSSKKSKPVYGKASTSKKGDAKKNLNEKSNSDTSLIRLNKYIGNSGVCSRREADTYIATGSVTVNGKIVTAMGYKVQPTDEVRFDGRLLNPEKKEYILLNKPKNFSTTISDERGRRTVMELISKASKAKLLPVGKLDRHTTGLLLFTNDGDMKKRLTQTKRGVRQLYHIELSRNLSLSDLKKIEEGILLEDGKVEVIEINYVTNASKRQVGLEINSGKNNIVRRIFEHLSYDIVKLDRVVYASLTKKDLPRGHWRPLNAQEIINLGITH